VEQIPLEYVPGLGAKRIGKLYAAFGTEMNVLHRASEADLALVVGEEIARLIILARSGRLTIETGGAGVYGRVAGKR
jgi:PHP family Zn ribbon phosphoesterase